MAKPLAFAIIASMLAWSACADAQSTRPVVPGQPQLDETEVIAPSQIREPRRREATPAPPPRRSAFDHDPDLPPARRPADSSTATNSIPATPRGEVNTAFRAVTCAGPFSKGSSHIQLAMFFGSENLTFTDVAGPEGSRLQASVLFPKNPKRRLEVLWHNEASRLNTNLIVIEGQSTWAGPRGLRLGMSLAALEKANGRPFKLLAFGSDGLAAVASWEGGAFDKIPGGCKLGVRLRADAKAKAAAGDSAANAVHGSRDEAIISARPRIAEIVVGYTP